MKKSIIFFTLFFYSLVLAFSPFAQASYNDECSVETTSEIVYLEVVDDQTVILEKNADKKVQPAAVSKMTAAAVIMEKLTNLKEEITVGTKTASNFGDFEKGDKLSVSSLLHCVLLAGENDALTILAQYGFGSSDALAAQMNQYAAKAGCKNTKFDNPYGYDADGQYTTAKDAVKIIRKIRSSSIAPEYEKIVSSKSYELPKTKSHDARKVYTRNQMLYTSGYYGCEGVNGMCVGYTDLAGCCITASASRNGYSYYAVVMKGDMKDIDSDGEKENTAIYDCRSILNWAFNNIKYTPLVTKGQVIAEVPVKSSADADHVALTVKETFSMFVPSNIESGSVMIEPIGIPENISAPVGKDEYICKASIKYAGKELAQVELVASEDVSASALLFITNGIKDFFALTAVKILAAMIILFVLAYIGYVIYINNQKSKKNGLKVITVRNIDTRKNSKKKRK